jgi:hypothetical protein
MIRVILGTRSKSVVVQNYTGFKKPDTTKRRRNQSIGGRPALMMILNNGASSREKCSPKPLLSIKREQYHNGGVLSFTN